MAVNKYSAKGFYYNLLTGKMRNELTPNVQKTERDKAMWTYFASQHEWNTYLVLRKYFDDSCIHRDQRLVLASHQDMSITYVPDFVVDYVSPDKRYSRYYVEAKGYFPDAARLKLKLLAISKPELHYKVAIVFCRKPKEKGLPFFFLSLRELTNTLEKGGFPNNVQDI